jgi:hypothetical protein
MMSSTVREPDGDISYCPSSPNPNYLTDGVHHFLRALFGFQISNRDHFTLRMHAAIINPREKPAVSPARRYTRIEGGLPGQRRPEA